MFLHEGKTCSATNVCGVSIICGGEPFEDALKGIKSSNTLHNKLKLGRKSILTRQIHCSCLPGLKGKNQHFLANFRVDGGPGPAWSEEKITKNIDVSL